MEWHRRCKNTALNFTALFFPEIADNIEALFSGKEGEEQNIPCEREVYFLGSHQILYRKKQAPTESGNSYWSLRACDFPWATETEQISLKQSVCSVSVGFRFSASSKGVVLTFCLKNINIKNEGLAVISAF